MTERLLHAQGVKSGVKKQDLNSDMKGSTVSCVLQGRRKISISRCLKFGDLHLRPKHASQSVLISSQSDSSGDNTALGSCCEWEGPDKIVSKATLPSPRRATFTTH